MIRASLALARRSLTTTLRRPQFLFPLVVFPTLFLAVNVGGLQKTTELPGFGEVNGFLDFQLAAAICQSMLIGGVGAGLATALDIEGGFFDRLVASPTPRPALVLGRLLATAALSVLQVAWFLLLGLLFGAQIVAGLPGVLVLTLIAVVSGVAFGAIGMLLAFRAKNASTVQGIFPIVFVVLFVSSAFFPRELLSSPSSWIADFNPLSYIAEGIRDPIVSELSAGPVLQGLAAAVALAVVMGLLALAALRTRIGDA